MHATLRARSLDVSLRSPAVFAQVFKALAASQRTGFRLIHFSVQSDHLHLIVEADSTGALTRGLQGLAVRCAKAITGPSPGEGPSGTAATTSTDWPPPAR